MTVMPGVKIGDGAIVAANSAGTKDVPPYAVAGGNPARLIRMRFAPETADFLLKLKWWDWPPEKIFENLDALCGADLGLIRRLIPVF